MFRPDVVALRQFYASALGQCVRRDMGNAIMRIWPDMQDVSLAGVGFALPYLRRYIAPARHVASLMLPEIGGMYWPADVSNHSVLCHGTQLPLQDNSVGRVLVCHAIEHSSHVPELMEELYRVLVPGGRALLVVPNRSGVWSRYSNNPFGSGYPYHVASLRHRAEQAGFTFMRSTSAIFYSPANWRIIRKLSRLLEVLGRLCIPHWGGVLLVEVEKQLYASIPQPVKTSAIATLLMPARQ